MSLKPNQAVDLMMATADVEGSNLRKAVLKQQSGPGYFSNRSSEKTRKSASSRAVHHT